MAGSSSWSCSSSWCCSAPSGCPTRPASLGRSLRIFKAETKGLRDDDKAAATTRDGPRPRRSTTAPIAAGSRRSRPCRGSRRRLLRRPAPVAPTRASPGAAAGAARRARARPSDEPVRAPPTAAWPLVEHLRELRNRLGMSLLALAVCVVARVLSGEPIFDCFKQPYCQTEVAAAVDAGCSAAVRLRAASSSSRSRLRCLVHRRRRRSPRRCGSTSSARSSPRRCTARRSATPPRSWSPRSVLFADRLRLRLPHHRPRPAVPAQRRRRRHRHAALDPELPVVRHADAARLRRRVPVPGHRAVPQLRRAAARRPGCAPGGAAWWSASPSPRAVLTPSQDPFTFMAMALPLYAPVRGLHRHRPAARAGAAPPPRGRARSAGARALDDDDDLLRRRPAVGAVAGPTAGLRRSLGR